MRVVAMLCMAMTVLFCLQFTVATIDRFAHATDTPHEATELAGVVTHGDHQHASDDDDGASGDLVDHEHIDEGHSNTMPIARAAMPAPAAAAFPRVIARGWHLAAQAGSPDRRPPRA